MDSVLREYIAGLIPKNFPDGRTLLEEGREIGKKLKINKNKFFKKYGYKNYLEYRKECAARGEMTWQLLIGLSTLEEEIDAIKKVYKYSEKTGLDIRSVQTIPSMLVGLPEEYWKHAPIPTSYLMQSEEDWLAHSEAAPISVAWQDWHLSSPNNLKTTIYAIKTGTPRVGTFSQLIWDYPGYTDEVQRFSDMVRSLGIIASKRDEFITADTYAEDGMPGYFLDVVSYVGYMLLEHYIIETLCKAKMSISFGGLLTEIQPRMAFAIAMHKMLGTEEEPILSYYNSGTVEQWEDNINGNYGISVQELLIQILVEMKYKMHTIMSPVSITEKLRVPTLQELLDIFTAGKRVEEKAKEWFPLMDFTLLEEISDDLIEKGRKFYENVLIEFKNAGVDIEDPLQMIMVIKRFNPVKFEPSFHPSVKEKGHFSPYHPSVLGRSTIRQKEEIFAELVEKGFSNTVKDRKIIAASADCHSYGLMLIDELFQDLNADVINGGVDMEPASVLDLADEEGTNIIMISIHCGQVLDYCRQIMAQIESRDREYKIFVGGKLNSILPGHTEPVNVENEIMSLGVHPSNDFNYLFDILSKI